MNSSKKTNQTINKETQRFPSSDHEQIQHGFEIFAICKRGNEKRVFKIKKERIVIGSVTSSDLRLHGEGVSPIHAVVEFVTIPVENVFPVTVFDLASETGVFVNGEKIVTKSLKFAEEVQIGRFYISFYKDDPRSKTATPPKTDGIKRQVKTPALHLDEGHSYLLDHDINQVEKIFKPRDSQTKALEVVMSWHGSILDIKHFFKNKSVFIGAKMGNDFPVPETFGGVRHQLIEDMGNSCRLSFNNKMKGVIQKQGEIRTLGQIISAGKTDSGKFDLDDNDFAKISLGEIDFYISYTPAPPKLKMQRLLEKDPFTFRVLVTSLVLSLFFMFLLSRTHIPKKIEAEELPKRIATILYQPEKFKYIPKPPIRVKKAEIEKVKETPKLKLVPPKKQITKIDLKPSGKELPKVVPKQMSVGPGAEKKVAKKLPGRVGSEAQEGAGAKAKGKEGMRGKPWIKRQSDTPQNLAKRQSPGGGVGRGGGRSQVPGLGNVDALKGAGGKLKGMLSNLGRQLGRGGKELEGYGEVGTYGKGGLALSGTGKGGGGKSDWLGGLADKGFGGGRVGTGLGAAGRGSGIVGGGHRVNLQSAAPEETVVMGGIDRDAIEAALMAHKDEFRLCYEREINAEHPNLSGRVSTTFVIGASGRVSQAGVLSTSLNNRNTERCIIKVIKRIQFPIPIGGGIVQVTYPFKFRPVQ